MRTTVRRLVPAVLAALALPAASSAASNPNIDTVTVARTHSGTFSFTIAFQTPVRLGAGTRMQVMLDTDRNFATGIEGSEYALDYSSPSEGEAPAAALLTAHDGDAEESAPSSLAFTSTGRWARFDIDAAALGSPSRFDFWVFVEENGEVVDTAPTHVLFSSSASPWTYPPHDEVPAGADYPVETYTDLTDTSLTGSGSFPWVPILLGVAAVGALVGIGGWAYEKLHGRTPPGPKPAAAA